ncbi:hypothetical protein EJB05_18362, partial [Eragrostis curvula]
MASRTRFPVPLVATLLLALLATCHAGGIAVYWGQNDGEASLSDTCASGNYKFVILAFVYKFGKGQTPQLDLASHCDPSSGGCTGLSKDIRSCQSSGVKLIAALTVALLATCHAGGIAVYWGQNSGEASLSQTCASGNYEFVILAFVFQFGQGRTPQLDLGSHCVAASGSCTVLTKDIRSCQRSGVKLSIATSLHTATDHLNSSPYIPLTVLGRA